MISPTMPLAFLAGRFYLDNELRDFGPRPVGLQVPIRTNRRLENGQDSSGRRLGSDGCLLHRVGAIDVVAAKVVLGRTGWRHALYDSGHDRDPIGYRRRRTLADHRQALGALYRGELRQVRLGR